MKVSHDRLRKIIKEEVLREMSFMSDQHGVVGDSILLILNSSPGIDGMSLVAAVQADLQSNPGAEEYVKTVGADEIFAVADDLQGTGAVWLDEEEDAWYIPGTAEYEGAVAARGT